MRVLVCGGRDYRDWTAFTDAMAGISPPPTVIIQGGAQGADALAADWATMRHDSVVLETYRADWQGHGRAAGPMRNQRMLDEGKPDLVVAFPGGRGTADMVRRAVAARIPVQAISA